MVGGKDFRDRFWTSGGGNSSQRVHENPYAYAGVQDKKGNYQSNGGLHWNPKQAETESPYTPFKNTGYPRNVSTTSQYWTPIYGVLPFLGPLDEPSKPVYRRESASGTPNNAPTVHGSARGYPTRPPRPDEQSENPYGSVPHVWGNSGSMYQRSGHYPQPGAGGTPAGAAGSGWMKGGGAGGGGYPTQSQQQQQQSRRHNGYGSADVGGPGKESSSKRNSERQVLSDQDGRTTESPLSRVRINDQQQQSNNRLTAPSHLDPAKLAGGGAQDPTKDRGSPPKHDLKSGRETTQTPDFEQHIYAGSTLYGMGPYGSMYEPTPAMTNGFGGKNTTDSKSTKREQKASLLGGKQNGGILAGKSGTNGTLPHGTGNMGTLSKFGTLQLGKSGSKYQNSNLPPGILKPSTGKYRQEKLPKLPKPRSPTEIITEKMVAWKHIQWTSMLHIFLGMLLFSLGLARLLVKNTWGVGLELVYGTYVALAGVTGVVATRRYHWCTLVAAFVMSALSILFAIPCFVIGLMGTIPDTFPHVFRPSFAKDSDVRGIDIAVAVVSLLEMLAAVLMAYYGCRMAGATLNDYFTGKIVQLRNGSVENVTNTTNSAKSPSDSQRSDPSLEGSG